MEKDKKINKQKNNTYDWQNHLLHMTGQAGKFILKIYFLTLMIIYPLYMQDGYREIGAVKYFFFRRISLVIMIIMLPIAVTVSLFSLRQNIAQGHKKGLAARHFLRLSATDLFAYGYMVVTIISYLLTAYKEEGFLGAEGWYMGLVCQLMFVCIYFMFSRYFMWSDDMLYAVFGSSALVFLLGILNRYSIYPIPIPIKSPEFISTLGNINWFCGYWSVIAPLGIIFYRDSRKGMQRAAAGAYVMLCFISAVTQGSRSAYLALAGIFVFLFCISFQENRKAYRFLEICILFALSCQAARLMRYLPGFKMNYEDDWGSMFTDTDMTLYMGAVFIVLYLLFYYLAKYRGCQINMHKALRKGVLLLIAVLFSAYLILTAANTCIPGGIAGLAGRQDFTFNDKWGNARGTTWICGLQAFRSMTVVQKLAGVGPDCFAEYIYKVPELAKRIYMEFGDSRLTNAHNEWITMLVNQGALGLICYAGFMISAIMRFIKKAPSRRILYLFAAGALSYTLHNMVSFQQILNTPFVFLIIGIGEGVLREASTENPK